VSVLTGELARGLQPFLLAVPRTSGGKSPPVRQMGQNTTCRPGAPPIIGPLLEPGRHADRQELNPLMITEPSRTGDATSPLEADLAGGDSIRIEAISSQSHRSPSAVPSLAERIVRAEARVTVIGLGYVGLPLALAFARAGFTVQGLDIDPRKIASLAEGASYIDDVRDDQVAGLVETGCFTPTGDPTVLSDADVVIICVPTPYTKTKQPDLTCIYQAASMVVEHLHPGMLVILESTTYPGTTQEVLQPLLEAHGLRSGQDFHLAYSPERVDPGNSKFTLRNTPKIVSGITPEATELAKALYCHVAETVVPVSTPRVAEMAKLMENTFRHVNIGLANEMAVLCGKLGIDIWEVIDAAATKPFGFMPFYPGPGVGGHCIPIDPYYFAWKVQEEESRARLIELAGDINDRMPDYVVEKVGDALNDRGKSLRGSKILVLGVAYKNNVADVRESPALKVIQRLHRKGAEVEYHDPHVPVCQNGSGPMYSRPLEQEAVRRADCVVILTAHRDLPYDMIAGTASLIVDTRNALAPRQGEHIVRL
jgi:UDP-N-acetyl-D-glucosamine dehydrogenase